MKSLLILVVSQDPKLDLYSSYMTVLYKVFEWNISCRFQKGKKISLINECNLLMNSFCFYTKIINKIVFTKICSIRYKTNYNKNNKFLL